MGSIRGYTGVYGDHTGVYGVHTGSIECALSIYMHVYNAQSIQEILSECVVYNIAGILQCIQCNAFWDVYNACFV